MTKTITCTFLLLCLLLPPTVRAQQQQVTGKINDNDGTPIAGASISVKGTTRGNINRCPRGFKAGKHEYLSIPLLELENTRIEQLKGWGGTK